MRITLKPNMHQSQMGVTLIELLISITIGLIILIGIGVAYVNTTNTTRQRENQSELNEPARIVMSMLRHDISHAGYVDLLDVYLTPDLTTTAPQSAALFGGGATVTNVYVRAPEASQLSTPLTQFFPGLMPVFGCDGAMNSTPNAIGSTAALASLTCGANSTTRHTLQLAYQAAPSATAGVAPSLLAPSANTGEGRDCNQQNLPTPAAAAPNPAREPKIAINRYFINTNASDGVNELYCAGSGNAIAQPIARGVEEFVIRYLTSQPGVAATATAPAVAAGSAQSQYASATTVAASALGWANVSGIEICIVSATTIGGGSAAAGTVQLQPSRPTCTRDANGNFNANIARVSGDSRLWKRFTSVVTVRNAIFSTPY
jgi:type IV pilus assembly protein PilW